MLTYHPYIPPQGGAAPPVVVTASLPASAWENRSQTLYSEAILSAEQAGDLSIAQTATEDEFAAWADAQPHVTGQAAGSITVTARGVVPETDIPVTLEVRS